MYFKHCIDWRIKLGEERVYQSRIITDQWYISMMYKLSRSGKSQSFCQRILIESQMKRRKDCTIYIRKKKHKRYIGI